MMRLIVIAGIVILILTQAQAREILSTVLAAIHGALSGVDVLLVLAGGVVAGYVLRSKVRLI